MRCRIRYPSVDFSGLTTELDTAFAEVQGSVLRAAAGRVEPTDEPAMRTLANFGFGRAQSEAALEAAGHAGDELPRTAAAVRWLTEEGGARPLYTELRPYEDDAATAVSVGGVQSVGSGQSVQMCERARTADCAEC